MLVAAGKFVFRPNVLAMPGAAMTQVLPVPTWIAQQHAYMDT